MILWKGETGHYLWRGMNDIEEGRREVIICGEGVNDFA